MKTETSWKVGGRRHHKPSMELTEYFWDFSLGVWLVVVAAEAVAVYVCVYR